MPSLLAARGPSASGQRRPDASMDLLRQVRADAVEPEYARVAAAGAPPSRLHWRLGVTLLLAGLLVTIAAVQTTRSAPDLIREREDLLQRVQAAEQSQDDLNGRIATTSAEIRKLRSDALGDDAEARQLRDRINQLDPQAGEVAVTGPGVSIVADDSADDQQGKGRVLDIDLQQLANGLWLAGAEAVAINGHRLTALTAIRGAGDAITVDYRSLDRPYRVEAIGDPATLQSRFAETPGGQYWNLLRLNTGMRFDVTGAKELTLPGDAGISLTYAKEKK